MVGLISNPTICVKSYTSVLSGATWQYASLPSLYTATYLATASTLTYSSLISSFMMSTTKRLYGMCCLSNCNFARPSGVNFNSSMLKGLPRLGPASRNPPPDVSQSWSTLERREICADARVLLSIRRTTPSSPA